MTTTTTETQTKTKKTLNRNKLLLKRDITQLFLKSDIASPVIAMPTIPSSPISSSTGTFYLPIKQKNSRTKGRYHQRHLRKPPSFDTYLNSSTSSTTTTPCGYLTRTPSISSSYSSTSSLADSEDLMYGYGFKSNNHSTPSVNSPRLRRGSSAFKVRFAEDDGSSIVSSSSGGSCADDWDDIEDDEEEDYILVPQHPPQHYYNFHKSGST